MLMREAEIEQVEKTEVKAISIYLTHKASEFIIEGL